MADDALWERGGRVLERGEGGGCGENSRETKTSERERGGGTPPPFARRGAPPPPFPSLRGAAQAGVTHAHARARARPPPAPMIRFILLQNRAGKVSVWEGERGAKRGQRRKKKTRARSASRVLTAATAWLTAPATHPLATPAPTTTRHQTCWWGGRPPGEATRTHTPQSARATRKRHPTTPIGHPPPCSTSPSLFFSLPRPASPSFTSP